MIPKFWVLFYNKRMCILEYVFQQPSQGTHTYPQFGYPTLFKTFFSRFRKERECGQIKKSCMTLGRITYHNLVNFSKNRLLTMKLYDLCRDIQSCFDIFGIKCSLLLLIFSISNRTQWKEIQVSQLTTDILIIPTFYPIRALSQCLSH